MVGLLVLFGLTVLGVAILNGTYRTPSGSTGPTLIPGDTFLVSRIAYGVPIPFSRKVAYPLRNQTQREVYPCRVSDGLVWLALE